MPRLHLHRHPQPALAVTTMALALLLAPAPTAKGGTIALDLKPSWRLEQGHLQMQVRVTNQGDEPACNLHAEVQLLEATVASRQEDRLDAGASTDLTVVHNTIPPTPGRYSALIRVHYEDVGGHPFTTLDIMPVHTDAPDPATFIHGSLASTAMHAAGQITLELQTPGTEPVTGRFTLCLPAELTSPNPVRRLTVRPGRPLRSTLDIANRWAQPGSTYQVFGIFDSIREGMHRSDVVTAHITITPGWSLSPRLHRTGLGLAALGLIAFAALQCRRRPPPPATEP